MLTIGIRHEDKYELERRAPLTPDHIKELRKRSNVRFLIEKSEKRIFSDSEYIKAGAEIVDNMDGCDIILGVKEMPDTYFKNGKVYIFFSHVIKGQEYNMPMLRNLINSGASLIDYEKIEDETGRRMVFFGRYAGIAGMINSLWSYGKRMKQEGFDTPLSRVKQARFYSSIDEAKMEILEIGKEIYKNGFPKELHPFVIGITGYGNVSRGAQEIIDLLPIREIAPMEVLDLEKGHRQTENLIYKVIFREENISKPKDPSLEFDLQHYYDNPELYENQFEQYVPHLSILMNCMYWDENYPRILTKDYLEELFTKQKNPELKVIGDITCDPDGSIECTHAGTPIEDPVFVYNPLKRDYKMGFQGDGILVMAVDILPSELPRDSSKAFGDALIDFIPELSALDLNTNSIDNLKLSDEIKNAIIVYKGELTPNYRYIEEFLD